MKFEQIIQAFNLPVPVAEYRFHPIRKWRLDYCWPEHKVALEVEGAVWTNGRHTRGSGFVKDMEKYNCLASMGYKLLRVTPQQLNKTETIELIKKTLNL